MIEQYQFALLELIKCSLFGTKPELPDDTDFDAVLSEAKSQTVVALAAPAVPAEHSGKWYNVSAESIAYFIRALYEQNNLTALLNANYIPFVIIKGCAAAVYYPDPERRTMGDIDFLVPEDKFGETQRLLEENGYTFSHKYEDGRDYTYTKGGVVFELHRRYSDTGADIEHLLADRIFNAVTKSIKGYNFPVLPDNENGLVLLYHIRHHLHGGLGIRQIIDWMMFVKNVVSDDAWDNGFGALIREANLEKFCKIVTKMCKIYFGLNTAVTWCDDADDTVAERLFNVVMQSGNFGRKNPYVYKPMEALTIDVRKNGLFKTLQLAGVNNYRICRKYRVFRPFAWLFQSFRLLRRGITALFRGEKLFSDITSGNKLNDFYEKLGIK